MTFRKGGAFGLAGGVACVMFGTLSASWAAQLLTKDTLIPSTSVTVARADGPTIKGTITSCTPELLTVQPDPKPVPKALTPRRPGTPAPADPPKPDPVALAWKDVRHVSSGLTPLIALQMWEAQNAGHLCPTCHGERTVWCPVCKGTRHDPAAAADCKTCKGELLVACPSKGEADGKVACPNGCLRMSVGTWTKEPDGKTFHTWNLGGGHTAGFSTAHIGQVIVPDYKNHTIADAGVCPICGGTILVEDPVCFGSGKVPCPECLARKSAGPCPNHCDGGRVVCPTCGGNGLKKG